MPLLAHVPQGIQQTGLRNTSPIRGRKHKHTQIVGGIKDQLRNISPIRVRKHHLARFNHVLVLLRNTSPTRGRKLWQGFDFQRQIP